MVAMSAFANSPALNDAENLFQLREFDSAFERFRAVQLDPYSAPADLALARCRMGIIYSIRDQQKQARQQLELALSSNALASSVTPLFAFMPLCKFTSWTKRLVTHGNS